jgi:2-methylisocitrate lyase-like PEP mutase family enzyme
LQETQEITSAVAIPVSMDAENAYADEPQAVFKNLQRIAASGVVGASIEDYSGDPKNPFHDLELAAERVRAAKDAVMDLGYPFVLTARAECYLSACCNRNTRAGQFWICQRTDT